jgi:hypothetical protein
MVSRACSVFFVKLRYPFAVQQVCIVLIYSRAPLTFVYNLVFHTSNVYSFNLFTIYTLCSFVRHGPSPTQFLFRSARTHRILGFLGFFFFSTEQGILVYSTISLMFSSSCCTLIIFYGINSKPCSECFPGDIPSITIPHNYVVHFICSSHGLYFLSLVKYCS